MSIYSLPYPPSTNALWRNIVVRGRPRTVKSASARAYLAQVRGVLAGCAPLTGPVAVELRVYRPRRIGDLDNTAKAVLDAVKGSLFVDDSQVVALHMHRFDDKANPRVEVFVVPHVEVGGDSLDVPVKRKVDLATRAAGELRNRHTDECLEHQTDPGATCICRPPATHEPLVGQPLVMRDGSIDRMRCILVPTPNVRRPR